MEVLTFGETMVLLNPDANGPLRYVNNFKKSVGGADSNVAIALSRLGHKSAWFSKLGNDEFGRQILNIIRGEGVDTSKVTFDEDARTGLMIKERVSGENPSVYYYRKDSAASKLSVDDINEDYIKQAKIIHITGITPAISKSARDMVFKVIDIAKQNNILISFDPNIRLKLWTLEEARPVLLEIAKNADIILPGCDEGQLLLDTSDEKEIADKFKALGAKIVVVKLGADGCYVANDKEGVYIKGFKINKVIDTAGAGDGFAAGFLSGILNGLNLSECGSRGNAVGAMATLVEGDMEAYPYSEQLISFMNQKKVIDR